MQTSIAKNGVTLTTDNHGGEAVSLVKNGRQYLWNADPAFWGRHAPVLFPFVGSLRNQEYILDGKKYPMGQHGFARDMEFELTEKNDSGITYTLKSTQETLEKYPFDFTLTITYTLTDSGYETRWTVTNDSDRYMPFSIGGHPAFMCPFDGSDDYRISFEKMGFAPSHLTIHTIADDGLINTETKDLPLDHGMITPTDELFAGDALIIENRQADRVSLLHNGESYLTVKFNTPLFGVWSPAGKHAPFICIEPWYGRADGVDFEGELSDRKYSQDLKPGETFTGGFEVILL